jgi:hypothetical protein
MTLKTKSVENEENNLQRHTGFPVCTFILLIDTGTPIPSFLSALSKCHTFNTGALTQSTSPSVTTPLYMNFPPMVNLALGRYETVEQAHGAVDVEEEQMGRMLVWMGSGRRVR